MTFKKLSNPLGLFGLKSFHGFVILGGVGEGNLLPALCLICTYKCGKIFTKDHIEHGKTAVKAFKKHQNDPTEAHKKRQMLFHKFLDEYL